MVRRLLIGLWLILLVVSLHDVSRRTQAASRRSHPLLEAVPLSQLDPRIIDVLTLGHRGVYDDFLAVWLVQMVTDPQLLQADPNQLHGILQTALRQQPKLESVYMLACFVMTFDLRHPEFCESYATEGMKALPQSWRLPATAGYVAAFRIRDPDKASLYYTLAAGQPGAPDYFKSFGAKLATRAELTGAEREQAMKELIIRVPGSVDGPGLGGWRMKQQEGP